MENGLQTIMSTSYIPRYVASHDCVDTGNDFSIIGGAAAVKIPINGLGRNKYNVKQLFNPATSNLKDSIVWSAMIADLSLGVVASSNTIVTIEIRIPNPSAPGGFYSVSSTDFLIFKNNIKQDLKLIKLLNAADDGGAEVYGFDFYISATDNTTLKNRSIIVAVF